MSCWPPGGSWRAVSLGYQKINARGLTPLPPELPPDGLLHSGSSRDSLDRRGRARCSAGKEDGMHRHKECLYRAELDLETPGVDPRPCLSALSPGDLASLPPISPLTPKGDERLSGPSGPTSARTVAIRSAAPRLAARDTRWCHLFRRGHGPGPHDGHRFEMRGRGRQKSNRLKKLGGGERWVRARAHRCLRPRQAAAQGRRAHVRPALGRRRPRQNRSEPCATLRAPGEKLPRQFVLATRAVNHGHTARDHRSDLHWVGR
jgi:hypothetical protein